MSESDIEETTVLRAFADEVEAGYDPADIALVSPTWQVLDRITGTAVARSSEAACREWLRAQAVDDTRSARYRVIPPPLPDRRVDAAIELIRGLANALSPAGHVGEFTTTQLHEEAMRAISLLESIR